MSCISFFMNCPLFLVLDMYKRIKSPREIWVYANEFHPMGPAAAEWLLASLDWPKRAHRLTGYAVPAIV